MNTNDASISITEEMMDDEAPVSKANLTKRMVVLLSDDAWEALRGIAFTKRVSMSRIARAGIMRYLSEAQRNV